MNANQVIDTLSITDIKSLLDDLGGEPYEQGDDLFSRSVCHNPAHTGKHKLVYYAESKRFHCFSECSCSFNVFGLIERAKHMKFGQAFHYICDKFNINSGFKIGFGSNEEDEIDMSFFKKFENKEEIITINPLDKSILNSYYDYPHMDWIKEGISTSVMKDFEIKFSIMSNQIIIPHFDIDNNLIGVRARNLNEEDVEEGRKYMPVFYKNKILKHPTGGALYGLNKNLDHIKRHKTLALFESEKSVLQLASFKPNMSIGTALSGSSITDTQIRILVSLGIENIVIGTDKEFDEIGSPREKFYAEKIEKVFIDRLSSYFNVFILWDIENDLELKDSPTDKGIEIFEKLWKNKIAVGK